MPDGTFCVIMCVKKKKYEGGFNVSMDLLKDYLFDLLNENDALIKDISLDDACDQMRITTLNDSRFIIIVREIEN